MSDVIYEQIGRSKNGVAVVYDPQYSHVATHLEDTPQLKDLVVEIVGAMELYGQRVATDIDMGRIVGTTDVVAVDDTDGIIYAKRKNRDTDGLVPFVKTREPESCHYVSIQLEPRIDGNYELASAWIGPWETMGHSRKCRRRTNGASITGIATLSCGAARKSSLLPHPSNPAVPLPIRA